MLRRGDESDIMEDMLWLETVFRPKKRNILHRDIRQSSISDAITLNTSMKLKNQTPKEDDFAKYRTHGPKLVENSSKRTQRWLIPTCDMCKSHTPVVSWLWRKVLHIICVSVCDFFGIPNTCIDGHGFKIHWTNMNFDYTATECLWRTNYELLWRTNYGHDGTCYVYKPPTYLFSKRQGI